MGYVDGGGGAEVELLLEGKNCQKYSKTEI